jgi:hypothetical protein
VLNEKNGCFFETDFWQNGLLPVTGNLTFFCIFFYSTISRITISSITISVHEMVLICRRNQIVNIVNIVSLQLDFDIVKIYSYKIVFWR